MIRRHLQIAAWFCFSSTFNQLLEERSTNQINPNMFCPLETEMGSVFSS